MEENNTTERTEEEIKERRRKYMKKYYRRKNFQIDEEGNFYKTKPQPPKVPPFKITHKKVVISFD